MLLPTPANALPAALAVLQHDQVVLITRAAQQMGIQPGMKRNSAVAIAPHAMLLERDVGRESVAAQAAALALLQYTPEVAHDEDNIILLNVGASLRVFRGPGALCQRVRQTLVALGLKARIGMAPTAAGAALLARRRGRYCRRRVLRLPAMQRQLNALPCLLLPAARSHAKWLQNIGCSTLGGLERLPRAELQRRTGSHLLQALDQAYGRAIELFNWVQPPPVFDQRLELPEKIDHAEAALFGARRLIEQLCGWLAARHLAASHVVLVLEHERGRHAMPPTLLQVRLAQPLSQAAHLLRLLTEKLPRLKLPASVIALRLSATHVVPADAPSATLFDDAVTQMGDHQRLLELLTARLGAECVLQPAPVADYRPEVANQWVPALSVDESVTYEAPPTVVRTGLPHPFWLLEQPVSLKVKAERPVYGSPLRLVRGPERIEAGWWDGQLVARDYFVAEDSQAVRYWVYRERDLDVAGWYLHGLFA